MQWHNQDWISSGYQIDWFTKSDYQLKKISLGHKTNACTVKLQVLTLLLDT